MSPAQARRHGNRRRLRVVKAFANQSEASNLLRRLLRHDDHRRRATSAGTSHIHSVAFRCHNTSSAQFLPYESAALRINEAPSCSLSPSVHTLEAPGGEAGEERADQN